jgi:hypothetical protein
VLVWVYFWLVIPFIGAGIGNWWQAISPWRTVADRVGSDVSETWLERATRAGMWPAVVAFIAFTWLELVGDSSGEARTLALAAIVYSVYLLVATRNLGVDLGLRTADAFENYNEILGAISPISWTDSSAQWQVTSGQENRGAGAVREYGLSYRGWLRGLPSLPYRRGFTAFVIAMIGTVTYDGMSGSEWWGDAFGTLRGDVWFGTLALLGTVAAIGAAYWLASATAARIASAEGGAADVARSFAHTLVPIGACSAPRSGVSRGFPPRSSSGTSRWCRSSPATSQESRWPTIGLCICSADKWRCEPSTPCWC